ncbi:MAG: hypothetical protein AVDCRST_MAG19-1005, partial [uncultured Thermomicrobiales bacterium]
ASAGSMAAGRLPGHTRCDVRPEGGHRRTAAAPGSGVAVPVPDGLHEAPAPVASIAVDRHV